MNFLISYAVKSLRKNKAGTAMAIIGVMMSAGLTVSLAALGTSLYHYVQEGYILKNGDWHIGITGGRKKDIENICMEPDVEECCRALNIGYSSVDTAGSGKPYLYLRGAGEEYYRHMPVALTEGHIPEKEGEILLPESYRRAAVDRWRLGDSMTLETGLRMQDGEALWQHVPYGYSSDGISAAAGRKETLQRAGEWTYTVCGFYEDADGGAEKFDTPGYEALAWWDGSGKEDGYSRFCLWFQIAGAGNNKFHNIYDKIRLVYGYESSQISINLGLLSLSSVRIGQKGESAAAFAVAVALLLLILASSVMLIYNAFAISTGERTRQFGMLSSVGATRKQIRKCVLYEAAVVGCIGTLSGACAGIAMAAAILGCAGETAAELMEFSIRPELYVWYPAVLSAMALAALTVLVSAWIPAGRAASVTPIEAVRQDRECFFSRKHKKTAGWVEAVFGLEGMLAAAYFRRYRKRYRAAVFALTLSMALFVSINAFSDYMMTVVKTEYKTSNYDVLIQIPQGQEMTEKSWDKLLEALRGIEGVESVTKSTYMSYGMPYQDNGSTA